MHGSPPIDTSRPKFLKVIRAGLPGDNIGVNVKGLDKLNPPRTGQTFPIKPLLDPAYTLHAHLVPFRRPKPSTLSPEPKPLTLAPNPRPQPQGDVMVYKSDSSALASTKEFTAQVPREKE